MTSDETRHSTLRSNPVTVRWLLVAAAVLVLIGLLTLVNWGLVLFVPFLAFVGIALAGTLWVMGMRGTRR
ncbi:MAG: hypothetical protein M0R75_06090 [Dehalococcoidia bacterium]|nr:hypothetical protein [Dehalococcoidia bacterium]